MSFGRPYILKINGCIHDGWLVFANIKECVIKDYLYYALSSDYIYASFSMVAAGSTVKNLKSDTVKQVLFPLPPIKTQEKIVESIEESFSQIDILDNEKSDLQTAINKTKSKILDLAIHGKLVPQDPNDEPAEELLKRIATNDNRPYEKVEEEPFEIPDSWCWCNLGMIGTWKAGCTPNKKNIDYYKNGTIPWMLTGDLNDNFITNIPNKITDLAYKQTSLKLNPANSVCIAMYGATIGKLGILSFPSTTNQACCVCSDYQGIFYKYLFYFLMQHKNEFIQQGFGGAQPNISKEKIISTLIPLPPLNEQNRIVYKIEELYKVLDQIQNNRV